VETGRLNRRDTFLAQQSQQPLSIRKLAYNNYLSAEMLQPAPSSFNLVALCRSRVIGRNVIANRPEIKYRRKKSHPHVERCKAERTFKRAVRFGAAEFLSAIAFLTAHSDSLVNVLAILITGVCERDHGSCPLMFLLD
jgi:hypothetical protein